MTSTTMLSTCEWCDNEFTRPSARGPSPKYCSNAHRQAAHRARDRDSGGDAGSMDLGLLVLRHRKAIIEIARRRRASNVRLFGSVARGDATSDSDIDLLVDLEPQVSLVGLAGLERELEELLGRDVDVVPASSLKSGLVASVEAEAIAL